MPTIGENIKKNTFSMSKIVDRKIIKKNKKIADCHRQPRKNHSLFILIPILLILIIISIFYLQNKYFSVKETLIKYNTINNRYHLTKEGDFKNQLNNYLTEPWLHFLKKNTPLTLSTQQLISQFKKDNRIETIKIIWHLPHKLELVITEKIPVAILSVQGDKDYYLDKNAQIIGPVMGSVTDLTNSQIIEFPTIYDQTMASYGSKPHSDTLKMAFRAFQDLDGIKYRLTLKSMIVTQNSGYFLAEGQINPSFKVYLLLEQDQINSEISRLKILMDNKFKDSLPEYVDLRFGEKVYYK